MSFKVKLVSVDVTAEDINAGERNKCRSCPVSLAIKRVCGPSVDVNCFSFMVDGCKVISPLPASAINFIRAFDDNEPVGPFSFVCMAPVKQETLLQRLRKRLMA